MHCYILGGNTADVIWGKSMKRGKILDERIGIWLEGEVV
jgi:hypothetical protein